MEVYVGGIHGPRAYITRTQCNNSNGLGIDTKLTAEAILNALTIVKPNDSCFLPYVLFQATSQLFIPEALSAFTYILLSVRLSCLGSNFIYLCISCWVRFVFDWLGSHNPNSIHSCTWIRYYTAPQVLLSTTRLVTKFAFAVRKSCRALLRTGSITKSPPKRFKWFNPRLWPSSWAKRTAW